MKPNEISDTQLLTGLCPSSICRISDYYYDSGNAFLKDVIDNCLTTIETSIKISGIGDQQENYEHWLLSVLIEIRKIKPGVFKANATYFLEVSMDFPDARSPILQLDQPIENGLFIITEDGMKVLWKHGSKAGVKSGNCSIDEPIKFAAQLNYHRNVLSNIVTSYKAVDTNIQPAIVARWLIDKTATYQEQLDNQSVIKWVLNTNKNFSEFRKQNHLPEAELQPSNNRIHKATYCHNCKQDFATVAYLECSKCNWLVCKCGACGCGHENWIESKECYGCGGPLDEVNRDCKECVQRYYDDEDHCAEEDIARCDNCGRPLAEEYPDCDDGQYPDCDACKQRYNAQIQYTHGFYPEEEVSEDPIEPWTDTADSWNRSNDEGWYYEDDD